MIRRLMSIVALASVMTTAVAKEEAPAVLSFITNQGGEVVSSFDAPSGLTGYVIDFQGRALTVYVTPDKQYLLTGAMLDAQGHNYGSEALNAYISGPQSEKNWALLQNTHWIADGDDKAPRIIYTFTDANCPYCQKLWQQARPWIDAGQVQLRHIMVGIIKQDSPGKAAAILAAENPSERLHAHFEGTAQPPVTPRADISDALQQQLKVNHQSMVQLGVNATPAMFYKDANGAVQQHMGLAGEQKLEEMFGPRP